MFPSGLPPERRLAATARCPHGPTCMRCAARACLFAPQTQIQQQIHPQTVQESPQLVRKRQRKQEQQASETSQQPAQTKPSRTVKPTPQPQQSKSAPSQRSAKPPNPPKSNLPPKDPLPKAMSTKNDLPEKDPQPKRPTSTASLSEPPRIPPSLSSSVPRATRQKALDKIYTEFSRIYAPILASNPALAHEDSIRQEAAIHAKSKTSTYTMHVISTLGRLRQRPIAINPSDTGIDGEWSPPPDPSDEAAASKPPMDEIEPFVLTARDLFSLKFPLEPFAPDPTLPPKPTSPEGTPIETCGRCNKPFTIKYPLSPEDESACVFHHGRVRFIHQHHAHSIKMYDCCAQAPDTPGCATGPHVFKEEDNAMLNDRIPFTTLPDDVSDAVPLIAIDCEMSYTTCGMELVRLTAVDWAGKPLLDELCKTSHPVLDLNTRWSGIRSLDGAKLDLNGVQKALSKFASLQTVILGHGLENDMRALRITHRRIVDTSVLFKHPLGLPHRHSLAKLTYRVLGRTIQSGTEGHDSLEDARACIDLLKEVVKNKDVVKLD